MPPEAPAATPPVTPPAATPAATPPAPPPPFDPLAPPPPPKALNPDDDTDTRLRTMIANRKKKPEGTTTPPTEPPATPPAAKPDDKKPAFGKVIAQALKFREPKPGEPPATPTPDPAAAAPAAPATPPPAEPAPEPGKKKSIVTKKKPDATAVIAGEAAAAAATKATAAVLKTLETTRPAPKEPDFNVDRLPDVDRREYEVAQYLASNDPRFKNAPQEIISQLAKTEKYAANWERANPGKTFDPNDEEHNDFYEGISKPWTESQFRDAEIEMAAARLIEKRSAEDEKRLQAIETNTARSDLTPVSDRVFYESAAALAKAVGSDVHDAIVKEGFDKFAERDPITAESLAVSLNELKPLIETIVLVDDPKGRIRLDHNNPSHQQWIAFTSEKEQQYIGATDDKGRTFATRAEYKAMTPAQRARHFYLTADDLLSELVADASKILKEKIVSERERQKKIAISLGFTPATAPAAGSTPPSNNGNGTKPTSTPAEPVKPASPSAGSGAKVGDTEAVAARGSNRLLDQTSSILFRRG